MNVVDDAGETRDGRLLAGPDEFNSYSIAEWEAMDPEEYAASLPDIPDHILDAAPEDDLPEHIQMAWHLADAARMPDPLTDSPGPGLAASLGGVADDQLGDVGLIDRITGFERQTCWVAAGQARAVAELAKRRMLTGGEPELGFFVDELALALTCTRYAAWARLHTALDLLDRLPATLTALECGRICVARARVIADGTRTLTDELARLVQDEVLPAAEVLTPATLRARVAAAVAAVDPRGADEAHDDACAERTVRKYPRKHGMTGIWALLPADHAAAVWAAVNTHAEATREPGDDRTADQRRADSLADLMTAYLNGTCPADVAATGAGTHRSDPSDHEQADTDTGPIEGCPATSATGATRLADAHPATSAAPPTAPIEDRPRTNATGEGTAPTHDGAPTYPTGVTQPTESQAIVPTDATQTAPTPTEPAATTDSVASTEFGMGTADSASRRGGCRVPGGHKPPKVPAWCRVQVKISAGWLLGHSSEAPILTGHGPLPADVALRLIADAGWQRIIYDPQTGALLDVGITTHDPPQALREHVLVRDGGCTQPICGNPRVDLDHNDPFPHGSTSAGNLRSRCRHHHHLKQHTRWEARAHPDGRIVWIAPTGHTYPEYIPDLRPGPTATPRPDPHIGPDADQFDDPPPF